MAYKQHKLIAPTSEIRVPAKLIPLKTLFWFAESGLFVHLFHRVKRELAKLSGLFL
jgi:hypothetical protein